MIYSSILDLIISPTQNCWISLEKSVLTLNGDHLPFFLPLPPLKNSRSSPYPIPLQRSQQLSSLPLFESKLVQLTAISIQTSMLNSRVPVFRHRRPISFWDTQFQASKRRAKVAFVVISRASSARMFGPRRKDGEVNSEKK